MAHRMPPLRGRDWCNRLSLNQLHLLLLTYDHPHYVFLIV